MQVFHQIAKKACSPRIRAFLGYETSDFSSDKSNEDMLDSVTVADVYAVVHIHPSTTGEPTLNGKLKRGSDLLTVFQTMGYNLFF